MEFQGRDGEPYNPYNNEERSAGQFHDGGR